jgi:hypothetical protein
MDIARSIRIIEGRSSELLRQSSIPENLWPEAVQHSVWLKNRSPARALRKKEKKTPWDALYHDHPTLTRERIWRNRAYVTIPPERRMILKHSKLHSPRGWLGYFVRCESESIYRIFSPDEHKVRRVGVAQVDNGQGLDDPQDGPSFADRTGDQDTEVGDEGQDDAESETNSSSSDNSDDTPDGDEVSDPSPLPLFEDDVEAANSPLAMEESDADDEDDEKDDLPLIKSKYFATMALKRPADDGSDGNVSEAEPEDIAQNISEVRRMKKKKRRRAAHDFSDSEKESLSSALSEMEERPRPKGKKWEAAKRRLRPADPTRCNRCFRM